MKIASWTVAVTFALLAGCGGKSSKPASPLPPDDLPATMDVSKLGSPCGEAGVCEVGSCVKYYGIAGPSGPEFSSCEVSCGGGENCPDGSTCSTIADGPGAVCRPAAVENPEPTDPTGE